MGFLWVNGFSFFHCVASPFHSFVTKLVCDKSASGSTSEMWSESVRDHHSVDKLMTTHECSLFWIVGVAGPPWGTLD